MRVRESAGSTVNGVAWYDGLSREVQRMSFGEGGTPVATRAYYDVMGRKWKGEGPFFGTGATWPQGAPADAPKATTTFDPLDRPLRVERSDGTYGTVAASFAYNGYDVTSTDPDGGRKTEEKDALGRIVSVMDHLGATASYRYNAAGDLLQATDAKGNRWVNTYDLLGRRTRLTDPDLGTRTFVYDRNGNLVRETDGKGQTIAFAYDALDRLTRKSFSNGDPSVTCAYDSASNGRGRPAWTDNGRAKTTYDGYDAMGRLRRETKWIGGTSYATQYAYDLSGKRTSVRHPDGTFVEYLYHNGSNLLWRVMSGGTVHGECTSYSPLGKIGRLTQGNGTLTRYGYDGSSGRLLSIVTTGTVGATGIYDSFDVVRGFSPGMNAADPEGSDYIDEDDNPDGPEDPNGISSVFDVVRGFSPGMNTAEVARPFFNAPETADPEGSDSIDGKDNPDCSNDVSDPGDITGADDDLGTGEEPEGAVVIQKKTYRYTRSGDLMRIRDDLRGVIYNYSYDGLHRLTAEQRITAAGNATTDTYGYDGIGNLTSKRTGGVQLVYAYDASRPHAVRSVRNGGKTHYFTYDPNGNLTYGPDLTDPSSVGWRSLSWTAENRPSEIRYKDKKTAPVTIRFEYDGEGRRTVKTVSVPTLSTGGNIDPKAVSTTICVNDAFQVANGKAVVHLFAGTVRIAEVRSGSVLYHHKDHLGSATVLTDKNGNRVETAEYLPFGELRESTGSWTTDYKFTDHELDTETGLYNFNARLYDPAVGRFISPDPLVQDPYDPQTLNRYAYCRNNPLIYVDPTGLFMAETMAGDDGSQYSEGVESYDSDCDLSGKDRDAGQRTNEELHKGVVEEIENKDSRRNETKYSYNILENLKLPSQRDIIMKNLEINLRQPQIKTNHDPRQKCGRWVPIGPKRPFGLGRGESATFVSQRLGCVTPEGEIIDEMLDVGMYSINGTVGSMTGCVCCKGGKNDR